MHLPRSPRRPSLTPTSLRHSCREKPQVRMTLFRGRRRATCPSECDTTSLFAAMPGMFCQTAIFARRLDFGECETRRQGGPRPVTTTVIPYSVILLRGAEGSGASSRSLLERVCQQQSNFHHYTLRN